MLSSLKKVALLFFALLIFSAVLNKEMLSIGYRKQMELLWLSAV